MASFSVKMGLFWAFSKLGVNTPTELRKRHASRRRGYTTVG